MRLAVEMYEGYIAKSSGKSWIVWLISLLSLATLGHAMKVAFAYWAKLPGASPLQFAVVLTLIPLPFIRAWQERSHLRRFVKASEQSLSSESREVLGEAAAATFFNLTVYCITINVLLEIVSRLLKA